MAKLFWLRKMDPNEWGYRWHGGQEYVRDEQAERDVELARKVRELWPFAADELPCLHDDDSKLEGYCETCASDFIEAMLEWFAEKEKA